MPESKYSLKSTNNLLMWCVYSDYHAVHSRFTSNQELNFVSHQPFPANMRTSTRPWCRPVFTQLQRRGLEKRFQVTKYVTKRERLQIGAMLGLSETQVKVWFQNRRTKWRHEAARKEEKQREEALKKAKNTTEEQELKSVKEEKGDSDDECSVASKESGDEWDQQCKRRKSASDTRLVKFRGL